MSTECSCAEAGTRRPASTVERVRLADVPAFRPAQAEDFEGIKALLGESELLADDLNIGMLANFLVAQDEDGRIACCIGFEPKGGGALLRSLAVRPEWRGSGVGRAALALIEQQAKACAVSTLYLLTKTAAEFFTTQGYQRSERDLVPQAVRETAQFAGLCPASAVCLHKVLL